MRHGAFWLFVLVLLLAAGCGGGGSRNGGNPNGVPTASPGATPTPVPPGVKAKVASVGLPGVFAGTTFSRSANPGVGFAHITVGVNNLHASNGAGVTVSIGGAGCAIEDASNVAGLIHCIIPLQNANMFNVVPIGTWPIIVTDQGNEAEQTTPPVTITIAP